MGKRLFVSYSRNDSDAVETLVADVRSLGHDPWVDRQLLGGQVWWNEVVRRIQGCDAFVFALSSDALNSKACETEYQYATALGKPILPVLVREGLSDSLMPQALSALQRVDYTAQDKNALSALVLGVNSLPPAPALPETMPPSPAVPATYLYDLKEEIDSPEVLTSEKQEQIVRQLTARLAEGSEPRAMAELLDRMQRRDDLLVRTAERIGELRASLGGQGGQAASPSSPAAVRPVGQWASSQPPPPVHTSPSAATTQPPVRVPAPPPVVTSSTTVPPTGDVNGAWWLAPILFGIVGGFVAWIVNKDINSRTARNMLIVGIVSSVFWYAALSSGSY